MDRSPELRLILNFRERSREGVYNSYRSISLSIIQVFGVDYAGAERFGGGKMAASQ